MFKYLYLLADVVIGWERERYEFDESAGQSRFCASVLEGTLAVILPELNIVTRDGTASRGGLGVQQDYIPMPTPDQFVFSSTNMGSMCTNIPIVNDNVLEQTIEDFFADLFFAIGSEPDRVTISPLTTEVDIIDNDSKCGSHCAVYINTNFNSVSLFSRHHYWIPGCKLPCSRRCRRCSVNGWCYKRRSGD